MLNIGRLDRTITIQRLTKTNNEFHTPVPTWTDFAILWAEVLQSVAGENEASADDAQTETLTFRTRYYPGITTADQLVFEGREFNIKAITEFGRREILEIRAVATP